MKALRLFLLLALCSSAVAAQSRISASQMPTCTDGAPWTVFVVNATDDTDCDTTPSGTAEAECRCLDGVIAAVTSGTGSGSDSFRTVNAPAGTDPVADSATDTLNITTDSNITVTGDSTTDTVALAFVSANFTPAVSAPAVDAADGIWTAAGSIVFEGSAANAREFYLTAAAMSSGDQTATFPDATGTVVLDTTLPDSASIIFDIGDDAGNDSTGVTEIATTGDTSSAISESAADKILIDMAKIRASSLNTWPVSASSMDDEFTSTTLDGKWTKTATSGNTTTAGSIGLLNSPAAPVYDLTTVPGWLMWQTDTASSGVAFTQAWTEDTTSMFFMRCQQDQRFLSTSQEASVHFGPTVAADTNESVFMWAYNSGAVLVFRIQVQNNGAFSEAATTGISESHPISPYIMLLARNGNSYYGFVSFNEGAAFTYIGSVTKTGVTTFDEVRIVFLGANETPSPIMGCDYFRYETDFDYPTFTR